MNLALTLDNEFIKKLTEIILENVSDENFGVDELAKASKMKPAQIRRRLHSINGQTINQFIRTVRLQKALELLQQDDLTASEIAYQVGFGSPTYFSKCFHDQFGFPPGEAKKREIASTDDVKNTLSIEYQIDKSDKRINQASPLYLNIRTIFLASFGVIAVLILVYALFPRFSQRTINPLTNSEPNNLSIAVLPVDNLTGNPGLEPVTEGIHRFMNNELSKLSNLTVRPDYTCMKFNGRQLSVQEIVKQLKVDIYLKPSLICTGDSFCVLVQLFQVEPEEKLLWSNSFVQDKSNLYQVFKNSALNVAEKLDLQLTSYQKDYFSASQPENPEFNNALFLGMYLINKSTPEDFQKAITELKKAISICPLDPRPYLALATGYSNSGHASAAGPDAIKIARAYAIKALSLDSTLAEAHSMLAAWALYQDWDFKKAEYHLKKASEFNSNISSAHYTSGWYQTLLGNFKQAESEMKKAIEIDPLDPICIGYLGWLYLYEGKWEEAIRAADHTLEIEPSYTMGFFVKGCALSELGKHDKAIEIHQKGISVSPDFLCGLGMAYARAGQKEKALEVAARLEKDRNGWNTWGLSLIYAILKDKEKTLKNIGDMYSFRMDFIPWINNDPNYKFLKKEQKFIEIVNRLKLPS